MRAFGAPVNWGPSSLLRLWRANEAVSNSAKAGIFDCLNDLLQPPQARLAPPKTLHDRAIFIDQTIAWTLTQSLKDFAKRSPAEIVRADDTAALKIAAYEEIWLRAQIIV
jgi:hypothetical protein